MTTVMSETFPINSAARNAVWVYDAIVKPRFCGAPVLVEAKRSYEWIARGETALRAPTRKPGGGTR